MEDFSPEQLAAAVVPRLKGTMIHIIGAPGSGTSTLGRLLAQQLGFEFFDADDYHWFTSDPEPYRRRRNPDHRRQLLHDDLEGKEKIVLSGSVFGWGDVFLPQFTDIVYLSVSTTTRLERIRAREWQRYGASRLEAGGDLHIVLHKFLQWAGEYDTTADRIRSKAWEDNWLNTLGADRVIRIGTGLEN